MTTNTTKLAEAIGIISSVLADEVAQTKHFVEVDDDEEETVPVSEYDELKEIISDGIPDLMTELEEIKNEVEAAIELDGPDDDDEDSWDADDDDEDDESDNEDNDDEDESEPTDEEKMDMLVVAGAELQEANERLLATLDEVGDNLQDLANNLENLQIEIEAR